MTAPLSPSDLAEIEGLARLTESVAAVRELHKRHSALGFWWCTGCVDLNGVMRPWPCPTIAALDANAAAGGAG